MNILSIFKQSVTIYKKDKWILFFAFIPVILGALLYAVVGSYVYTDVLAMGSAWIKERITSDTFGTFVVYFMVTLLTIAFYLITWWTFTLIVSVISSPFNDVLSKRVERALLGKEADTIGESISEIGKGFFSSILNELKKISLILILTIVAFFLSFIPLLTPFSMILSSYLMSITFLDYSWTRKSLKVSGCINVLRKGFVVYSICGFIFLGLVAVPLVQFFVIPLGVIFYTVLYTQRSLSE
jgi:CysZ protein